MYRLLRAGTARAIVRPVLVFAVLALLLSSGLRGSAGSTTLAVAQQVTPSDRAAVLTSLHAALNNGDVDGAAALFASNAVFVGAARSNGTCTQTNPCSDVAGIRQQLQNNVVGPHSCFTLLSLTVSGAVVTGQRRVQNDSTRKNGVEAGDVEDFIALVPGSQITFFAALKNIGDAQTARDLAISAGTAQPTNPPILDSGACG
jgi:hypothetical protein